MEERRYFAGNNTSAGFYSYFDSVFNPAELKHFYILKGGPGVGKSSFMKKFAAEMAKKNYSLDYIHCSSDNESLDGIIIHDLKIAFVDGTAPHTIDPKIPGAVDEILNLGEFLDSNKLEKHTPQIMHINQNKSLLYKSAYRYLQAAGTISEEINSLYNQFINNTKFNEMCKQAIDKLFHEDNFLQKTSKIKKLFSESYTANGYINRTKPLYQGKRVWVVIGENTSYTSEFLKKISDEASKRGYDLEQFYRPLVPNMLQHVFVPEMNLFVISSDNYVTYEFEEIFDIHSLMDTDNLKIHITEIENNLHLFELLINNALEKLAETKKYHELLEVFYINSMDFNGVDEIFKSMIEMYT